jgi:hypothetical protein
MAQDLLLGWRIGEQLASPGIDTQGPDPAQHAFSRQREHHGNRPVDALANRQVRGIAAELRA